MIADDRVLVTLTMLSDEEAKSAVAVLPSMGCEVVTHYHRWIDAWVPIDRLADVSQLAGVSLVHRPIPVHPLFEGGLNAEAAEPSFAVHSQAGQHVTEGVVRSNAHSWHAAGVTGRGVRIGVLDSFQLAYDAQLQGELPATIAIWPPGSQVDVANKHGTGVAEIVHDMAPGAELTFASLPITCTQMAYYIDGMARAGMDIISSSVGPLQCGPGDGRKDHDPVAFAADQALNQYDTLFVQAAGNQAQKHWDGWYQGASGWHEFVPGVTVNQLGQLPQGAPVRLSLRWNSWPTTNQDYDLYLMVLNGQQWTIVAQSVIRQMGWQPPTEAIITQVPYFGLYGFAIFKHYADGNQVLDVMDLRNDFYFRQESRSLVGGADGYSFSVAAVDVNTLAREVYSSQGPTHGPGGSLEVGLPQPQIAGFANVDTWSYGVERMPFSGTSAATPHVAGAAALVREAYPDMSAHQVGELLKDRSVDTGSPGYDYLHGRGILHLGAPPSPMPERPAATTASATGISATGATLNGVVNDNGAQTAVSFEYGTTTGYGATKAAVPDSIAQGSGDTAVTATLSGLTCNTSYQFRVRAQNSAGTSYGANGSFTTAACPTRPEIAVEGNGRVIADGDATPGSADHTDFGTAGVGAGTLTRAFTIRNTGNGVLHLGGAPRVALSGSHAGDFAVAIQPSATVVVGGTTTFTIRFDPSAAGLRRATVSIANNDADEDPYDFAIQGTGTPPGRPDLVVTALTAGASALPGGRLSVSATLENQGSASAGASRLGFYLSTDDIIDRTDIATTWGCDMPALAPGESQVCGDHIEVPNTVPPGSYYVGAYADDGLAVAESDEGNNGRAAAGRTVIGSPPVPEITIEGNGVAIADGDNAPSPGDDTDFGSTAPTSGTVGHTFTIRNTGSGLLHLGGTPRVALSGSHAGDFAVAVQPSATVAVGGTTTFKIRFDPSAAGLRRATVSIANDDADENPYDFAIQGTGEAELRRLRVVTSGQGVVVSSPAGISCGMDCRESYPSGTEVTLTATAANNCSFVGWGGACTNAASNMECVLTMTKRRTVNADFACYGPPEDFCWECLPNRGGWRTILR